jgi:UDPglucose 6-dehydrogenase
MKVGFVGLGKLGLPTALAIESRGHDVMGYDVNPEVERYIRERHIPYREMGASELLKTTNIRFASVAELVRECDFVYMSIQTPHHPDYEGITRLPISRVDFDYHYLIEAVQQVIAEATAQDKHVQVVVVSTALPGTMEREIKPLIHQHGHLVYNPAFIAMGTTINDFLHPEFVLMGADPDNDEGAKLLSSFYATIHDRPTFVTDIKTAELIKVSYNTYIGAKIAFANTMMEICEKIGANVDDLTRGLSLATTRLLSPKYLSAGMGDGGGCHPRDNIAMSWLAQNLELSHNLFEDLMLAREHQTDWLADVIEETQRETSLPVILLGRAYKPETNLTVGSPAVLLSNILSERKIAHELWDPYVDEQREWPTALYFISTNHQEFEEFAFPEGSVVVDPWRMIPEQPGIRVIGLGKPRNPA